MSDAAQRAESAHYSCFAPAVYGARLFPLAGGGAQALWQPAIDEPVWNHARLLGDAGGGLDGVLRAVAAFYTERRLPPVVATRDDAVAAELGARGWQPAFRLAWLFATERIDPADIPEGMTIRPVRTVEELGRFHAVFSAAFGSDDYRPVLALARPEAARTVVEHYLFCLGGEAAACGTVARFDGIAGLYNLGVDPRFRRRGLGAMVTSWRVTAARAAGCEIVYLQTEEAAVEALQLRAGFAPGLELRGFRRPFAGTDGETAPF